MKSGGTIGGAGANGIIIITYTPVGVAVSGISWMKPWEPPYFERTVKRQLMPTFFYARDPATPSVGISGVAWMKPWEPPYFAKKTSHYIHQTSPAYGTAFALPVGIFGMTWWKAFDQPKQRKTDVAIQQFELRTVSNITTPVGIDGISWWYPFDQPKQIRVNGEIQQTSMHTNRFLWQGGSRAFILGGAR